MLYCPYFLLAGTNNVLYCPQKPIFSRTIYLLEVLQYLKQSTIKIITSRTYLNPSSPRKQNLTSNYIKHCSYHILSHHTPISKTEHYPKNYTIAKISQAIISR